MYQRIERFLKKGKFMKQLGLLLLCFFSLRAGVLSLNIHYEEEGDFWGVHAYLRTTDADQQKYIGTLKLGVYEYNFKLYIKKHVITCIVDGQECIDDVCNTTELGEICFPMVIGEKYQLLMGGEQALTWIVVDFKDETILNNADAAVYIQNHESSERGNICIETQFGKKTAIECEMRMCCGTSDNECIESKETGCAFMYIEQVE